MPEPLSADFAGGQTLLFDKPSGWTSFDVVNKVRRLTRHKKVGHAGTLDPLATGLLILCTGKHTKRIEEIQAGEKEYELVFKLGAVTASYDAEFPETQICDASGVTQAAIEALLPQFTGEIQQVPPAFSAVKVGGKRAYAAARTGKPLELKARTVQVYAFGLLDRELPPAHAAARVRCSKGTYIRSLVHDLGQALGTGAYLTELRRTAIGPWRVEDAWSLDRFEAALRALQAGDPAA
ncbi:MAG: tRNA pseudouridine(55) synthase TruB [Bacteroidia bacterium]|nr:tRNA pseudouridine(55) synthase TruB [Bacteroidia bacterium]